MVVSKVNKTLLSSVFISRIRNTGESSIASGITRDRDIAGTSQAVKGLLSSNKSSSDLEEAPLQDRVSNLLPILFSSVLIAAGDSEGAKALVSKIPKDDKDVQHIIEESQIVYSQGPKKKTPKRK